MGICICVGTERQYERNGVVIKMNVIELESDGFKMECALFGPYVDDLNSFLASGEIQLPVVIIQLAKVKSYQDLHIKLLYMAHSDDNNISVIDLVYFSDESMGYYTTNSDLEDEEIPNIWTATLSKSACSGNSPLLILAKIVRTVLDNNQRVLDIIDEGDIFKCWLLRNNRNKSECYIGSGWKTFYRKHVG